mgnify:CR=1 FL=1
MINDNEYQDDTITEVSGNAVNGWSITKKDGWSFWVPADSPVEPVVGMAVRMYSRGIGYTVRGLVLDGQTVFYRTEAEDKEHTANQMYGKDATELLAKWDADDGVWSVAMGGFGPGYEQALQIAVFEVLRYLLDGGKIEEADAVLPSLSYLGLSGAQWGAARGLASAFYTDGPRKTLERFSDDRKIQVSAYFPQAPERAA